MNEYEFAAWEVHMLFSQLQVPYAIIGGMAVQHWGEPRFTQDVDLTVAVPLDAPEKFIQQVLEHFVPRIADALAFALKSRVILVKASNQCPIDISLGLPGYEDEVMQRVVKYEIEKGKFIFLCSAEDLVIHKAVAGRPQDLRDIEGIVYRQQHKLDSTYIRQWINDFADLLYRPEIVEAFERPWKKIL